MKKHSFKDWLFAVRPWSFPASTMPVLDCLCLTVWYCTLKGTEYSLVNGFLAIFGIVLFHASGNVISDYFDHKTGVDKYATDKPLTNESFTPKEFLILGSVLFVIAVIMGFIMLWRSNISLLYVGILGSILTLVYPFFKYRAMGDIFIFVSYAIVPILGTSIVVGQQVNMNSLIALAIPVGLITVAILHANNIRDIVTDNKANIRTFAGIIGKKASIYLYHVEILLPYIYVVIMAILGLLPYMSLLVFISLPIALKNCKQMQQVFINTEMVVGMDGNTAKLQMIFSLLLSAGMVIETILL